MNNEPTIGDVLYAVNKFSFAVDERFDKVESRLGAIEGRVTNLEEGTVTKDYLEQRLAGMETCLVTKDYLDNKLADLRGDMVMMMRKEDTKLKVVVGIM